jgi:uncharacterized protein YndB with AHSA1/START domain
VLPSQIEKEILIEAPLDVVWRVVTEPDQITKWFIDEAEIDPRPGGRGRFFSRGGQTFYFEIEAFEPPRRFAYRWGQAEGVALRPENSMLVEFTLQPEAGSTRLRVVESGFDQVDWSDKQKTQYFEDHSNGWGRFLPRLRDYAPGVAAARRE